MLGHTVRLALHRVGRYRTSGKDTASRCQGQFDEGAHEAVLEPGERVWADPRIAADVAGVSQVRVHILGDQIRYHVDHVGGSSRPSRWLGFEPLGRRCVGHVLLQRGPHNFRLEGLEAEWCEIGRTH